MSPDVTTNDLRQRGPPSSRDVRVPRQSQQPSSPAHRTSPRRPKQSKPRPNKVMSKCHSEPLIFQPICDEDDNLVGDCPSIDSGETGCLTRFHTLDDVLTSTPQLIDFPLTRISASYDKDAKVLITVTVEGSPGPIRTLVKLGTSVEDTINLVVHKYAQQGRTPHLDKHSSSFDLHVSYFSLQCLDRTDAIGEAGSRSFYLRKKDKKCHDYEPNSLEVAANGLTVGIFPPFIATKINKIERRFIRLFKILGCLDSK